MPIAFTLNAFVAPFVFALASFLFVSCTISPNTHSVERSLGVDTAERKTPETYGHAGVILATPAQILKATTPFPPSVIERSLQAADPRRDVERNNPPRSSSSVGTNVSGVVLEPGMVLAKTYEPNHPTNFVAIARNSRRVAVTRPVYETFADQTLALNQAYRLVTTPTAVLSYSTSDQQAPGTVAHAEGRKRFSGPAVVDHRSWYGAVVQNEREILLFESFNSHHQGVVFIAPKWVKRITSLAWGGGSHEWDLIVSVAKEDNRYGVFRLTPAVVYPLPAEVAKHCPAPRHLLTECMMRHYKKMPKEFLAISEEDDYDATSVR